MVTAKIKIFNSNQKATTQLMKKVCKRANLQGNL